MMAKQDLKLLISDKTDFKMKAIRKDKEGHYLMLKGSIQEEDINIYAPNIGVPQHIQQILADIKGEIDRNAIIIGDFNSPLTAKDKSFRQKINKATEILKDTIEKLDLIDISRTSYPKKIVIIIYSFQMRMEYSQGLTTYWGTKLTSTNLRV